MPWPKGKPRDQVTREKISIGNKGQKRSEEFCQERREYSNSEKGKEQFRLFQQAALLPEARNKANETLHKPDHLLHFINQTKRIHTGRKRSAITRKRIKEFQNSNLEEKSKWMKEFWNSVPKEERVNILKNAIVAARLANPSSIEIKTSEYLNILGINHQTSIPIGRYVVDILIDNIVIECDGDYWHNLPGAKEHDEERDIILNNLGYTVIRITETQINNQDFSSIEFLKDRNVNR